MTIKSINAYLSTLQDLSQSGGSFDPTVAGKTCRIFFQTAMSLIPPVLAYRNPENLFWGSLFFGFTIIKTEIFLSFLDQIGYFELKKSDKERQNYSVSNRVFYWCLTAPITEEILFRGLLQPSLTRAAQTMGITSYAAKTISILATSLLFGMAHLIDSINPHRKAQSVNALFSGLFYGVAKERFGLSAAIFAHILNNCYFRGIILLSEIRNRRTKPS